jgi:succinate dehydrogenase/fumarate reductase-like Fe-S protein
MGWLEAAHEAQVSIPTGCLGGSCGACEIDVNGRTVRACVETVPAAGDSDLWVEIAVDPYW